MGGTTGNFGSVSPPPTQRGSLDSVGGGGRTYFQQRPDVATAFNQNSQGLSPTQFSQQHFQQFGQFEGNVSDPSKQFFQPVYQPQQNNYATTNRLGVSQYGTPMTPESLVDSAYAGIGRFGVGTGTNQMDAAGRQNHINAFQTGHYTPQNFFQGFSNSVQDYHAQNPNDRYTQYTQNQPGYMGGFTGFSGGFMPQMQAPFNPYTNSSGGGFGGGFMPQQQFQMQTPFSQPTNNFGGDFGGGFGGGFGGFGGGFMPQQQFQPQMNMGMQTPFQQPMQQPQSPFRSSGPSQAIVGRSSQMRGTPNVMRRAEGGITSLMDEA